MALVLGRLQIYQACHNLAYTKWPHKGQFFKELRIGLNSRRWTVAERHKGLLLVDQLAAKGWSGDEAMGVLKMLYDLRLRPSQFLAVEKKQEGDKVHYEIHTTQGTILSETMETGEFERARVNVGSKAGTNAGGHYLPPSSPGWRR